MPLSENMLLLYARYFPLRRGKLRVVNTLWRSAAGRPPYNRIAVLRHGNMRLPCDLNEMLQRQFYYFGTYFLEDEILRCWEVAAKDTKVVFDIGANAGIFSLAALASNPAASVHAFEPTPEIAMRLRATKQMNGLDGLVVNEMAVADRDGVAVLRRWRGEDNSNEGMNFISIGSPVGQEEVIPTVSLDSYCAAHGIEKIDLLKIDIQGNEPLAFAGAKRLLQERRIGYIFAELNWQPGSNEEPAAQMIEMLENAGYIFARPSVKLEWREAGAWMRNLSDIVARPA